MKSYFIKKSKALAHNRKRQLYGKLVQDAQVQAEKLQSRIGEVDELLKEVDNCLVVLETETTKLGEFELDSNDPVTEWEIKVRDSERVLGNLRAHDEELQR
uniref:Uncharacterized protein n=1 Tax=Sphenodon punctatus TaxID=8508 RepID=A0A8D0G879_SPHPU